MKVTSPGMSILVVDDNKNYRSILRSILYSMDVRFVVDVSDAAAGLEQCRAFDFDLAFVDRDIPGLNGLDFCKILRTADDSPCPNLPLVMTTPLAHLSVIKAAINAGFEAVLLKPLIPVNVHRTINRLMARPSEYVQSPSYRGPCRRRGFEKNYTGPLRRKSDSGAAQTPQKVEQKKEAAPTRDVEIVTL